LRPPPVRHYTGDIILATRFRDHIGGQLAAASWTFLTNHARVLLCIAHDPGVRLRDIAARLDITERSAYGIVTDLARAGYIVKQRDGRRNRYQIQEHLPLPEPTSRERTVGEMLALLVGDASAPP
jgi:MarR family